MGRGRCWAVIVALEQGWSFRVAQSWKQEDGPLSMPGPVIGRSLPPEGSETFGEVAGLREELGWGLSACPSYRGT